MKISLIIDQYYRKNEIFNSDNIQINRDDCQRQWIELRESLQKKNIQINTVDITSIEDADIVMFINIRGIIDL